MATKKTSSKKTVTKKTEPKPTGIVFHSFTKAEMEKHLAKRGQNRTVSAATVKKYREEMNEGLWRQNDRVQAPLIFNEKREIVGGQHRAEAFVASKLETIVFPVIWKATEEEIINQDGGYSRSFRHLVEMRFSIDCPKTLQAKLISAARLIGSLVDGEKSHAHSAEIINGNAKAVSAIAGIKGNGTLRRYHPLVAALLFTYGKMQMDLWKKAASFLDSGAESPSPVLLKFREKLLKDKVGSRRSEIVFCNALSALMSVQTGKPVSKKDGAEIIEDWKKLEKAPVSAKAA